ncbi:hypothetical protein ACROYT_G029183 [Oculina patagonica]
MSFGAECFLHCDREGFKGKIKQTWQDFVVTEIDTQGKLVELIKSKICSANEDDKGHKTIDRKGNDKERTRSKECTEENVERETPFLTQISESFEKLQESALNDLGKSLGDTKLKELKVFALYVESNRESNKKICIGSKMTKEDRTSLHRNVRLAFPYLQTQTIQNEQEGDPRLIFAANDKVFWEFIDLLNDRYQVDRLLCFAHWENRRIPSTFNLDVSRADKQQRTKIHRLLSRHFGSFLESKTFNKTDNKSATSTGSFIQIRMRVKGTKPLQQKNKQSDCRQTENEYTGFVLCKRNMETLEAIQRLSACLNIQPSAFSYAGIKDKKAITKQYMVVRGVTPEQMCAIEDHPSLEGIECGSYRRGVSRPLRMGALSGNHFQVVIRNIQCDTTHSHEENLTGWKKLVEDSISSLSLNGFLNYFGPQRFGLDDKEVNACDIGLAMLQGNMAHAVKLLMTPSEQNPDNPVNSAKRYYCETGDVQGTLGKMPAYKVRETLVLKALHRHGTDMDGCRKALLNIPYSMRLLYVHSYCSLVWNQMASYRIRRYGRTAAVQGDLIVDKSVSAHEVHMDTADSHDGDGNSCRDETCGVRRDHVRCLSDNEEGTYLLRDVVLPLPGYNVQYPTNDVGEKYKERLETDGLTVKSFRLKGLGMNLPGAYRKLVAFPGDLSWKCVKDEHGCSVNTSAGLSTATKGSSRTNDDVKRPRLSEDETQCADVAEQNELQRSFDNYCNDLEISFSLEPSCYATSCLRELTKN